MKKKRPLIIAHRGASYRAPENTLAAFRLAVEEKCDGIELDVHLTLDKQLVVIHDENIQSTTNGKGLIENMTVAQLKKFDAGSWFNKTYSGEKIPLLEEVFQVIPAHIIINIEIKNIPSYYQGIEAKLLEVMKKYNRINNVIVSSFDHLCLVRLKRLEPNVKIGLLGTLNLVSLMKMAHLLGIPVYALHPKYTDIKAKGVMAAKTYGYKVFPWTVNHEKKMYELLSFGVNGIITDRPATLRRVINMYYS